MTIHATCERRYGRVLGQTYTNPPRKSLINLSQTPQRRSKRRKESIPMKNPFRREFLHRGICLSRPREAPVHLRQVEIYGGSETERKMRARERERERTKERKKDRDIFCGCLKDPQSSGQFVHAFVFETSLGSLIRLFYP